MSTHRHEEKIARWAAEGREGTPPVNAATVILIRDHRGELETLMLRRNSKIAFGGMWVFPGGRVDPGDLAPDGAEDDLAAARRAAVREAQEEAGLELSEAALLPYSHWTPPPITPKRFLTWFFLAMAPPGDIVVDGGEIHEHQWQRPGDALSRRDAGEIELAPPTWVTLYELARHENVEKALADARAREPERFQTHIAVQAEGPTALWHGDAGWEASDADVPGPRHRLCMHVSGWHYLRSDGT